MLPLIEGDTGKESCGRAGEALGHCQPREGAKQAPCWDRPQVPQELCQGSVSELPLHGGMHNQGQTYTAYSSLHENDGMSFIHHISRGDMDTGMWLLLPQWLWQHPQGQPCSRWDVRSSPVPSPADSGSSGNLQPSSTTTSPQKNASWGPSEHSAGTDTNLHSTVPSLHQNRSLHFHSTQLCIFTAPTLLLNTTGYFKCTFHTKPPKLIAN